MRLLLREENCSTRNTNTNINNNNNNQTIGGICTGSNSNGSICGGFSINNNNNNSSNGSVMSSTILNNFLLLNPLNPDFKRIYFSMLPKVVSEALDNGSTTIDECKQMLSSFMTNPQLTWDERQIVQNVTNQLENLRLLTRQQSTWGVPSVAPLVCPTKTCRSLSLTGSGDVFSRMKTFRCDVEDVSPLQKKFSFAEPNSGMKDVPIWLKSLRLHKYAPLFAQMTYDDMMQLTEEQLELKGVTVGARRKIILSVQKLKDRVILLKQLEKDLNDAVNIRTTLNELKIMINTPIRPRRVDQSENDDIPLFFTRTLCRACSFLLSPSITPVDDECFGLAVHIIDRCLNHEAFLPQQKKRLASLKQDIKRIWVPPMRKLSLQNANGTCFVHNKDRRFSCDVIGSNHSKCFNPAAPAFFTAQQKSSIDYSLFNLYRQNCNQHKNLSRTISAPVSHMNLYQNQIFNCQPGAAIDHHNPPAAASSYSPWSTFYSGLQRSAWSCGFEDSVSSPISNVSMTGARTNTGTGSTNSVFASSSSPSSSNEFNLEQLCERMTVAAIDC